GYTFHASAGSARGPVRHPVPGPARRSGGAVFRLSRLPREVGQARRGYLPVLARPRGAR
ncbi:MAG: hypothetical protein AVDCRST_MAG93-2735, partial [uncultured Chloroflexia bacterium]